MGLFWPGRILIGTSGWDYDDWVGPFYEEKERRLSQYCRVFETTEINSTFYSLPTPGLMKGLARATPRGFVFAAKLYKGITHEKKLNPKLGVESLLAEYLRSAEPLRKEGKLGPILVQMPPKPRKEFPYFEDFLALLPDGYRFAVEFRDLSWLSEDVFKLLEKYSVAYVIVDEPLLPPVVRVTSDIAYIRWHGRGERPWYYYLYSEDELREWVPRVREAAESARAVYGYFNNHFRGYAPRNALQMLKLLNLARPTQLTVLRRMNEYSRAGAVARAMMAASKALAAGDYEKALASLTTPSRMRRGVEIPESQVKFEEVSPTAVRARVKEYKVIIDLERRVLAHDCADWEKIKDERRLCKHVVRVISMLPPEMKKRVLEDLAANLNLWEFTGI